jgi:hypothetical protein
VEADINRIIRREFPEIASGYHLPILGRIEAISDAPVVAGLSDHFRPMMAVDLIILDKRRNPVKDLPVFKAIPLPISFAGLERGHFAFPEPGSLCEIAFMYGMADQLFVRQVFGWGLSIPAVNPGDVVDQAGPGVVEKTDAQGNKTRTTHGTITDAALLYRLEALEAIINLVNKTETIKGSSVQRIRGKLLVKAFGAIRFLSGGVINLSAIDNINITTASDLMTTVAGNNKQSAKVYDIQADSFKASTSGNIEFIAEGNHTATVTGNDHGTAAEFQRISTAVSRLKAPKTWIGSNSENALTIISELITLVKSLADALATHTHNLGGVPTTAPNNAVDFTTASTTSTGLQGRIDTIKE